MFLSEVGYYRCHLVPIPSRVDDKFITPLRGWCSRQDLNLYILLEGSKCFTLKLRERMAAKTRFELVM